MANEFQPVLQGPQTTKATSGNIRTVDTGGVSSLVNTFAKASAKRKENEADAIDSQAQSSAVNDIIDLRSKALQLSVDERQANDDLLAAHQRGVISDQDKSEFDKITSRLSELNELRLNGIGNPAIFELKAGQILKRANTQSPRIAPFIKSFLEGSLDELPTGQSEVSKAQVAITDSISREYGPNFTDKNRLTFLRRNQILANADQRAEAGNFEASRLTSEVATNVQLMSGGLYNRINREFIDKGALSEEFLLGVEGEMATLKTTMDEKVHRMFVQAEATGAIVTQAQKEKVITSYQSEFDFINASLKDKDLNSRIKLLISYQEQAIESQFPALMTYLKKVEGAGGLGSVDSLLSVVKNKNLKAVVSSLGNEFVDGFDFSPDEVIAQMTNFLVNGVEVRDPSLKKVQTMIAAQFLKEGRDVPNAVNSIVTFAEEQAASVDEGGAVVSGNVSDGVRVLLNDSYKRGLVRTMTTEDKNQTANMVAGWADSTIGEMQSVIERSSGSVSVLYDRTSKTFKTQVTKGANPRGTRGRESTSRRLVTALNDMNRLTLDPLYKGIVLTNKAFISEVNKSFNESLSVIEETKRLEQEEEDRGLSPANPRAARAQKNKE